MKKIIKSVIEYVIVFAFLLLFCFFINKAIAIKALYKDDLYTWTWFPGLNLFEYAFKFYEGSTRYRPFFDALQFFEYKIAGHNPMIFLYFNIVFNTIVATFVYHFAKALSKNRFISYLVASLYIFSHFAYYQIGQMLGTLETEAQIFALIILYMCFKITGIIKREDGKEDFTFVRVISIFILYFIIAFTHERFLCLAPVILIAILASKTDKSKLPIVISFILEVGLIFYIRFLVIGKAVPAGTGGTYVEETFSILTCIKYCFTQVAFIFGFNIGPEYLVGSEFINISRRLIKFIGLASVIFLIVIVVIYFVKKINIEKKTGYKPNFIPDLLFATFIAMCIGASSVTIRVEMRFVYVSFTVSLLYLSYMIRYIYNPSGDEEGSFGHGLLSILVTMIFVLFFVGRTTLELQYRTYFKNIHFFVDQDRVNSLYDITIGKYGKDAILNGEKKVYLVKNFYDFTDYYAEWFYTIYDKDYKNHPIIMLESTSDLPNDATKDNGILVVEDIESMRGFKEIPIE